MKRREFITGALTTLFGMPALALSSGERGSRSNAKDALTVFLCGDVMTGRGIDQILPFPSHPQLHEPYVQDARDYVALAERASGAIARPVDFSYVWGDSLAAMKRQAPDVRIVNLETSVTTSDRYWYGKGINYRMHPRNIKCLTAFGVDCCVLANNHVLDWGYAGLRDTLHSLHEVGIKTAGAGADAKAASVPAILDVQGKGRVFVFSYGFESSGVSSDWAATSQRAGVNRLPDLSPASVARIAREIEAVKQKGDVVIASLHWGSNWGYSLAAAETAFAHELIDTAAVDIVHGHSSHHAKALEVYHNRLILYGCGDFINDYEGIGGYEEYRADLCLMYFARVAPHSGELLELNMMPMQIRHFRLNQVSPEDGRWFLSRLNREVKRFGCVVESTSAGEWHLRW